MKNVMKRAWEIAREGFIKFGGKVVEYFAEALKLAWLEVKSANPEIKISTGSRKHKTWIAKIVGPHAKFKLDRVFMEAVREEGWTGKVYELEDGIYEVCNGERYFIEVANKQINTISKQDVLAAI